MKKIEELSGRELDAAVAHEVMGFVWWKSGNLFDTSRPRHYLSRTWYARGDEQVSDPGELYIDWNREIPLYSSTWAAARDVVEKVDEYWDITNGFPAPGAGWEVMLRPGSVKRPFEPVSGTGVTLPEAICRAALAWARRKA